MQKTVLLLPKLLCDSDDLVRHTPTSQSLRNESGPTHGTAAESISRPHRQELMHALFVLGGNTIAGEGAIVGHEARKVSHQADLRNVGTGLVARWQPDFSPGCPRATHRVLIIIVAGTLSKEHLGML
jgi:hypothetical protein